MAAKSRLKMSCFLGRNDALLITCDFLDVFCVLVITVSLNATDSGF
jgi:hypothetical protein